MFLTRRIFTTLFLMTFILLVSCNKDDEDNDDPQPAIVGTWNLTDVAFTFDGKSVRDFFEQYYSEQGVDLTEEQLDEIEAAFNEELKGEFDDGNTFEFQANGTLVVNTPDEDSQGTWQMPNNNTLVINDGTDATEFTIESLTNSQLKISVEGEEEIELETTETVTIALTLSLTKQ